MSLSRENFVFSANPESSLPLFPLTRALYCDNLLLETCLLLDRTTTDLLFEDCDSSLSPEYPGDFFFFFFIFSPFFMLIAFRRGGRAWFFLDDGCGVF